MPGSPLFIPSGDAAWETVSAFPVGQNRVEEDRPMSVRWVPMFETNHVCRSHLGLTDSGEWIDCVPDRHTRPGDPRRGLIFGERYHSSYFYLAPMLEWAPSVVWAAARFEAERFGFDVDDFWMAVPWKRAIRAGIRSGRNQWVNPALDWAILTDVVDEMFGEIELVADGMSLSDSTRSRIQSILKDHGRNDR